MGESLGSSLLPDTKAGKASGVIGIIAAIVALVIVSEGGLPSNLSISSFTVSGYSIFWFLLFMALIPLWLFMLSSFFMSFGKTKNKPLGWLTALVAFIASLLGFLATFVSYVAITQMAEFWDTFLLLWDIEYLLLGVTLLLGGFLFLKIGISSTEKKGLVLITAIVYLAVSIFGLLAGLSTATSMISLFDRTIYPRVAGAVIVPSIFTIGF
jgi:hypothetical protein